MRISRIFNRSAIATLTAASRVVAENGSLHFLLAGKGTETLGAMVAGYGLTGRVHLLGARRDVERLLPGLDVCCLSSSFGEGFPNVLGEAMACGVPCVVTDVGDSAVLVGDTGKVVPPRNPQPLANAWAELIDLRPDGRRRLGDAARQRIQGHFDLDTVVKQYERCYDELAAASCSNG